MASTDARSEEARVREKMTRRTHSAIRAVRPPRAYCLGIVVGGAIAS